MSHGSRLTAHGSRLTAHGSRLTAHGSRLTAYKSWLMANFMAWLTVHGAWLMFEACGADQVSIMPCVAMDAALAVPFSAAIACVEWCKNNFENIAAMGGRQRTGIYVAAWGSNSLTDSDALRAVIQRAGARSLPLADH